MSHSSKPTDSTTNPSTPLSPFPSTPHRLSYIQQQYPNQSNTFSPLDSPIHSYDSYNFNPHQSLTDAHISPTKAAQQTRLNHEINTITSWLEGLFATPTSDPNSDNIIPIHFLKWKGEVLSAAANSSFDGPVPLLGALSAAGTVSASTSTSAYEEYGHSTPTRPTHPSRHSSTNTNITSANPVLDSLKSLKQVNLSADYLATLLHDARLEELHTLQSQQSQVDRQREQQHRARILLDELHGTLTPDAIDALRSLSESAVTLGLNLDHDLDTQIQSSGMDNNNPTMTTLYAQGILRETRRKFFLEQQVRELEGLADKIKSESTSLVPQPENGDAGEKDEDGDHDTRNEKIHAQTAQYNRDTKQINLKIMEYHDRVTSMERQLGSLRTQSVSLQDVLNARARVEDRRARVKALQERFAAFNGLPPDLEDSRSEVKRAMAELESLKKRREGLFERMGTV